MTRTACLAAIAWCAVSVLAAAPEPSIVPNPASLTREAGEFSVGAATAIAFASADSAVRKVAVNFSDLVRRSHGVKLDARRGPARDGAINLVLDAPGTFAPEAYRLEVRPGRITIRAATPVGLFRGATTLWQMLAPAGSPPFAVPAAVVDDTPRFAWRGIMLDSARHFQSPAFIRRFIDAMAAHKLNVLHWHLTDDQAWRLEIRKYPKLTQVGAWRVPAGAARADIDAATGKPRLQGGFYSQREVRGLVAYAAERGITIVPEIEMPGHASAALAAYPRFAATANPPREVPADWGVYPNAYSLDEATFRFLEDVLGEVMALFPSRYIHVGGDEVEKTQWRDSSRGQALMRELGTADPARLQVYFTQRIARFLERRGRTLVGWDEVLEPGLPQAAVVMSWRGVEGALKAAALGHDTVLAAHPTLYFDNRQSAANGEPPGRVRVVSLEDVYRFEPMPAQLTPGEQRHVLGVQGNVWTEHIRSEDRVGWMTFPRAAAIAELGWSQPARRDWGDFRRRLAAWPARYEALGITYARSTFEAPDPIRSTTRFSSNDLKLCGEAIALVLEDDAPLQGPRAQFAVDIQNPCWILPKADLTRAHALVAAVGQVPFNFQIGEDVRKIRFPPPTTREGELEVRLDSCDGPIAARLPLASATASDAVTVLPRAPLAAPPGIHDLCLRFAQPRLDPMWVIDSLELVVEKP
jgi:hexosaminidase